MPSNRMPSSSRVLNNRSSVSSNRSVLSKQPSQQRAQQAQQPPQRRVQQQPERTSEVAQAWQQQRGWVSGGGWQGHATWQQERKNRSQNWVSDHRSWAQRGGYGDYYIPQNSFDLYFGSQHFFRLRTVPVMYMGYPRFDYGGYSFLLVDPYPAGGTGPPTGIPPTITTSITRMDTIFTIAAIRELAWRSQFRYS